ncbi:MAG: flagellar filament capping protein FliD [Pseudomonadales bacterium]|nr:flagellar filament capping protein FliD [Pseudomonadales bacterium]
MATIQSLGIGSGLLTSELLDDLIAAEREPVELRLDANQELTETRISALGEFRNSLADFDSALQGLTLASSFNASTASSSAENLVTATASSLASKGEHSISVTQLAQSHVIASESHDSINQALGTGVLTFRFGATAFDEQGNYQSFTQNPDTQSRNVIIGSGNSTLGGIRDAVNAANIGVQASIVDDGTGFRLLFSAKASGAEQSIELTASGSTGLQTLNFNLNSANASLVAQTDAGTVDLSTGAGLDQSSRVFSFSFQNEAMTIELGPDAGITDTASSIAALQARLDQALISKGFAAGDVVADGSGDVLSLRTADEGFDTTLRVISDGDSALLAGSQALSAGFDFAANNASFSIAIDGGAAANILLDTATASAQESVDLLNTRLQAAGMDTAVVASLASDGSLVLTRTASGAAATIDISALDTVGTAASTELGLTPASVAGRDGFGLDTSQGTVTGSARLSQTVAAQDALFTVSGIAVKRSSNLVTGVIPGLTLNLKGVTPGPVALSVDKDPQSIIDRIEGFVAAFNELKTVSDSLTAFNPDAGENGQGSLFTGDSALRFIRDDINRILRGAVTGLNGNIRTLTDIGITTNQNNGFRLDFNVSKFQESFAADPQVVQALFAITGAATDSQIKQTGNNTQTQPGTYALEITRLATTAAYQGIGIDTLAAGNIVIDDSNDEFTIDVNGVTANIKLQSGNFATAAELASHLQDSINGHENLLPGNNLLTVSFNEAENRFEFESSQYGSTSKVNFLDTDAGLADTLGLIRFGQGDFQGNQLTALGTPGGSSAENFATPVTIDSAASFQIQINGQSSGLITLPGSSLSPVNYNSPDELVAALQAQIDADSFFQQAGAPQLTVAYSFNPDNQQGRFVFSTGSQADSIRFSTVSQAAAAKLGIFTGIGSANPLQPGLDVAGTINGVEAIGQGQQLTAAAGNVAATPGFFLNTAIGNLAESTLADRFTLSVDGVVSGPITLGTLTNTDPVAVAATMQTAINNNPQLLAAGVGVVVEFDPVSGGFGIISQSTGIASQVQMVSLEGNAASIFGFAPGFGAKGGAGKAATGQTDPAAGLRVRVEGGSLGQRGTVSFIRGVADRLNTLVDSYLSVDGLLANRNNSLNAELAVIAEQREALEQRLARSEARLRSSFLSNDLIISQLNTTADFLTSQLSILEEIAKPRSNNR